MGEDLDAEGRLAVRTPMQWTSGPNGGFSTVEDPDRLPGPVVDGGFAPEFVNVADQRHDPDSLLSFMKLLIRRYRESPELGWGAYTVLDQPHRGVLAHLCSWDDGALVAVHNLGPEPRKIPLTLADCGAEHRLVDLLQPGEEPVGEDGAVELALDGYGHRWLRVVAPDSRRLV
jgi:glycosidase